MKRQTPDKEEEEEEKVPAAVDPAKNPERKIKVNGSEAATIVGENPYETSDELLFKKMVGIQFKGNEATEHGKKHESTALRLMCKKLGCKLLPIEYMTSKKYPWMGGTIDAMLEFPDGTLAIAEVKCPLTRRIKPGVVPGHYRIQPQQYMLIWNSIDERIVACYFVQYTPPSETPVRKIKKPEFIDIVKLDFDRRYMLERLPAMKTFWDKMYSWQSTIGIHQSNTSARIITECMKKTKSMEKIRELAKLHYVHRLKAAAAKRYLVIPYQTPKQLRDDFCRHCIENDPKPMLRFPSRLGTELHYPRLPFV